MSILVTPSLPLQSCCERLGDKTLKTARDSAPVCSLKPFLGHTSSDTAAFVTSLYDNNENLGQGRQWGNWEN